MNDDLISREALKKALKEKFDDFIPEGVYDEINNAPTVEALLTNEEIKDFAKENFENGYEMAKAKFSSKQGEWITDYTAKQKRVVACNKCNCISIQGKSNFCPNCGADMRGDDHDG